MRISDWSSDVCSSDLGRRDRWSYVHYSDGSGNHSTISWRRREMRRSGSVVARIGSVTRALASAAGRYSARSEEHTSELPSLMRISYADFCLKKKKQDT